MDPRVKAPLRWLACYLGLVVTVLAWTIGTAQAETVLGTMRFEAPVLGWETKPVRGGMIFQKQFPADDDNNRKGAAMIQVLGPFQGAPTRLDELFESALANVKGLSEERPILKSDGLTSNGHRIRSDYRCCARVKNISASQSTVVIASQKSQVVLALLGLGLRGKAQKTAEAEFAALVRSVRIEPEDKPFALQPASGDGGLDGAYTHLDTGVRPNAFGGMDTYSDSTITVFDPSGLFSTEVPKGGDIAAFCRDHSEHCGLYRLIGGGFFGGASEIEMRSVANAFGVIETETKALAKKGDDLLIDDGAYNKLQPFPGGTTFNGTWRDFFASVGTTAFSSASIASERLLTLSPDGTFKRTGWSGASSTSDVGDTTTGFTSGGERPAASGRYRIEGYSLDLTGSDGKTERLSIFAPDRGSDSVLVIDGVNYLKQE
ncbi:hypothetical protein BJF93_13945 [Xaviernesmea oryzae]|uniref:Uncharacterized protein n=1 Tax=Xaviernesmea oryzae TaxID=464029 RepID=A0A1Q9AR85_9HYPH|nr:hypothetical protein [Xaviernesmea oryzae]OLP57934.1 hypothetical protein BJF93_13945 [Xaviernesmea oryzae]SEL30135.1 hypothetical protein SAMN04487976_10775 [Xaviernesmea oryzae]